MLSSKDYMEIYILQTDMEKTEIISWRLKLEYMFLSLRLVTKTKIMINSFWVLFKIRSQLGTPENMTITSILLSYLGDTSKIVVYLIDINIVQKIRLKI